MVDEHFSDEALVAHIEGELGHTDAMRLEAALEARPELRVRYERQQRIATLLRDVPAEVDQMDFVASARAARVGRQTGKPRSWTSATLVVVGLAGAAAAALVLASQEDGSVGFTAKSEADAVSEANWTGIRIYDVDQDGNRRVVERRIRVDSALAFSYTNVSREPYSYLMVVGVDERGECFWYHPPYLDASTNPTAVPIEGGRADVALPDRIEHDLGRGTYEIHALFMRKRRTVREIERFFATQRSGRAHVVEWPDVEDHFVEVLVER